MKNNSILYWKLPAAVVGSLVIMYFSGVSWMVQMVCPSINWEFGIVENLQLILILLISISCFRGVKLKTSWLEKSGLILIGLFSLLVFFEEMDWGAHFVKAITGEKESFFSQLTGSTNIHNQGGNAKWFKRPVYLLVAGLFIFLPLLKERLKHPLLVHITPDKGIIYTTIIGILSDLIPRAIVYFEIRPDGGFGTNIGEFSEMMLYYIFLLFVYEMIFHRGPAPFKSLWSNQV